MGESFREYLALSNFMIGLFSRYVNLAHTHTYRQEDLGKAKNEGEGKRLWERIQETNDEENQDGRRERGKFLNQASLVGHARSNRDSQPRMKREKMCCTRNVENLMQKTRINLRMENDEHEEK